MKLPTISRINTLTFHEQKMNECGSHDHGDILYFSIWLYMQWWEEKNTSKCRTGTKSFSAENLSQDDIWDQIAKE